MDGGGGARGERREKEKKNEKNCATAQNGSSLPFRFFFRLDSIDCCSLSEALFLSLSSLFSRFPPSSLQGLCLVSSLLLQRASLFSSESVSKSEERFNQKMEQTSHEQLALASATKRRCSSTTIDVCAEGARSSASSEVSFFVFDDVRRASCCVSG